MTTEEVRATLASYLAKFRSWSYSELADRVESDANWHECLAHFEGIARGGTEYQVEINAFWDDRRRGDVRVIGSISVEPQRRLFGLPVYVSDATDSFIMNPNGEFVGE